MITRTMSILMGSAAFGGRLRDDFDGAVAGPRRRREGGGTPAECRCGAGPPHDALLSGVAAFTGRWHGRESGK
jgi:hypothetical protein